MDVTEVVACPICGSPITTRGAMACSHDCARELGRRSMEAAQREHSHGPLAQERERLRRAALKRRRRR